MRTPPWPLGPFKRLENPGDRHTGVRTGSQ